MSKECKHKFHFVGFVQIPNVEGQSGHHTYITGTKDSNTAEFMCEKCGKIKKVEKKK